MTSGRPNNHLDSLHDAAIRQRGSYRHQHSTQHSSSLSSNEVIQVQVQVPPSHRTGGALPNHHHHHHHHAGGMMDATGLQQQQQQQQPEHAVHPTPLHGRYVTENVVENKMLSKVVANQRRRMEELERVHRTLELELEAETKKRQQLEVALEVQERQWQQQQESLHELLKQREKAIEEANAHNKKLSKQLETKSNEMFQMMRRMYPREGKGQLKQPPNSSASNSPQMSRRGGEGVAVSERHGGKTPHTIRKELSNAEKVRSRKTMGLALDFFGL